MKKMIFASLLLIGIQLSADEWKPYWIEAIKDCYVGDYSSAENHFQLSIECMEYEKNLEHPSVYIDRARLYMTLKKHEEALEDIDRALLSKKLEQCDRLKAISLRIAARLNLGFSDGYEKDIEYLFSHFKIPNGNAQEQFAQCLPCAMNIDKQLTAAARIVESCKLWCNDNAQAAIFGWCAFFPEICVINACNKAVLEIQGGCHLCCENLFNQDICAAPFVDIVSVMQKYLPSCGCP